MLWCFGALLRELGQRQTKAVSPQSFSLTSEHLSGCCCSASARFWAAPGSSVLSERKSCNGVSDNRSAGRRLGGRVPFTRVGSAWRSEGGRWWEALRRRRLFCLMKCAVVDGRPRRRRNKRTSYDGTTPEPAALITSKQQHGELIKDRGPFDVSPVGWLPPADLMRERRRWGCF